MIVSGAILGGWWSSINTSIYVKAAPSDNRCDFLFWSQNCLSNLASEVSSPQSGPTNSD